MNIGKNVVVHNNNSEGFDIGPLQLQTKSIISSNGFNIGRDSGSSKLTISKDGVVNTSGEIVTSSSLNSASLSV